MQGLSRTQTETALAATGLNAAQKGQVLSALEASAATKTLTTEQALQVIATTTGSMADAKALLVKAGLATADEIEKNATIQITEAKIDEAVANYSLTASDANVVKGALGITTANASETASFGLLTKAVWANIKAMAKWLVTTPAGWATLAIGAIVGLVSAYNNVEKKQNELIENAQTLQEEYRNTNKTLSENVSSLEEQKDEFKELSKGVDDYGKNISLSTSEYDKYKSIVSEILSYSPELIEGYDKEGNAIANKNNLIERSIELLKQEQKLRLEEMTTDDKTSKVYEGVQASRGETRSYEGANTRNKIASLLANKTMSNGWRYDYDIAKILGIENEWKGSGNTLQSTIIKNIETVAKNVKAKKQELLDLKDAKGESIFTADEIDEIIEKTDTWQQQYTAWQKDVENFKRGMSDQFELYAQKADGYDKLTDAQKAFVTNYIKATGDIVDADGNMLSKNEIIEKANGYTKFVKKLATDPDFEDAREYINELFSIDKSKMSAGEYEKQVETILKELQDKFKLSDGAILDFKIALGFAFTTDGNTTVKTMIDGIKAKIQNEAEQEAKSKKINLSQIIFGNIDLDNRKVLEWTDENIEKYKSALESWGQSIEEYRGGISTVDGQSEEFDGVEIAFSPMLQTKNGAEYLDSDTVHRYINSLIEKAGEGWTNEYLFKLDADGLEIDGKQIKGLIADIGETAIKTGEAMHFLGEDGAINLDWKNLEEELNNLSFEDLQKAYNIISNLPKGTLLSWDELQEKINAISDSVKGVTSLLEELEKASDKIGKLSTAYKELSEDGYITIGTINDVKEATGLSGDEWTAYETKLLNAKKGSAEFNQVMSDLTYKIVENNVSVGDLINATDEEVAAIEKRIAATLRENGVANAGVVTQSIVKRRTEETASAKYDEALANYANAVAKDEDANAALSNAQALLSEYESMGFASSAMEYLNLVQNVFSNSELDVEGKINALKQYGFQASLTAEQLKLINNGGDVTLTHSDGKWWVNYYDADRDNWGGKDYLYSEEFKGFEYNAPEIIMPDYTSPDDKKKEEEERKKKQLEAFKLYIQKITQHLTEYSECLETLKETQDSLYDDDYVGKLDYIIQRYSLQAKYTSEAKAQLDELINTIPETADEWDELATAVENVSQKYFESKKALIEYQVEIAQTQVDAIKTIAETSKSIIDESSNLLDRNIDSLSKGGLRGLSFDLTPTTPQDAVDKQKKENDELIAEERVYQNKINEIKRRALDESEKDAELTVSSIKTTSNVAIDDVAQNMESTLKSSYETVKDAIEKNPINILVNDDAIKNISASGGGSNSSISSAAQKYIGTPYIWGGSSASGMDCSGFVYNVLKDAGYNVGRTTAQGYRSYGTSVSKSDMQAGDLVFFGKSGNASHVGVYIGNGKIIHSSGNSSNTIFNPGKGVSIADVDYRSDFLEARRYAAGTRNFGIAGENYRREYLVDKETGEWTAIDSPTLIDTNKVDVVGEEASKKINKPLPMYADGTLSNSELLNIIKDVSASTGVPANVLMAVAQQETGGRWYDKVSDGTGYSYGYMMLYDNGVIADLRAKGQTEKAERAKTDPYTNVLVSAEYLKSFYEQGGGDWKYAFGRYNGSGTNGKYANTVFERMNSSEYLQAAQNLVTIANNVSTIKSDATTLRESFDKRINDVLDGISENDLYYSSAEDEFVNYIQGIKAISDASNDKYLEAFNSLNEVQKEGGDYFAKLADEVKAAVGTNDFQSKTQQFISEASAYSRKIMGATIDTEVYKITEDYETLDALYNKALEFYALKQNEGVTASELKVYADGISTISERLQDLSDDYTNVIEKQTDFLVSQNEIALKAFDDELSWIAKDIDDNDEDSVAKSWLYSQSNAINARKKAAAHQQVIDLYSDDRYLPIFEQFDIESWFDAEGGATAKFQQDLQAMTSAGRSELLPFMQQIVEIVGTAKKAYYESSEAIRENNQVIAGLKVEKYIEYQNRLAESLSFDSSISSALSAAKQGMYGIFQALREEKSEIDKELKANMQIDDWLTEDTRAKLFNLDDYEKEVKVINEIQASAQRLYNDYQSDLANLKEDELYKEEEITNEYNRQLERLQDKLAVTKAELQLAKDKAAFENALKERDTQIIMGNRVQNVADPEKLREYANALAESENALNNENLANNENADIRNMEAATGLINQEKAAIENRISMIESMTDAEKAVFANFLEPIQLLTYKITSLSKTNPDRIIRGDNSNGVYLSRDFEKQAGYSLTQDHSGIADIVQNLTDNNYYKKGTPEYAALEEIISRSKLQHDDKTTSDPYNYGYSLYDTDNAFLWLRGALKIYSDDMYERATQDFGSINDYLQEIVGSKVGNGLPHISGDGYVQVSTPSDVLSFKGEDYELVRLDDTPTTLMNTLSNGDFNDIVNKSMQSLTVSASTDIANAYKDALKYLPQLGSSNSVHMGNVNVTLEKQISNADTLISELVKKAGTVYDVTKNQR